MSPTQSTPQSPPLRPRKIAVVTGTRAEYGLLYWLMKEIQADQELQLQLIVTGAHLSPEFGSTWKRIEEDGFAIDAKVEMLLSSDTPVAVAKSVGLGTIGFSDALDRLKPDILLVLGDRFEILSAVTAAAMLRIPVAHLHGGESTEGAVDEAIRHAVTKMAHLHFTAAEEYRKRVVQMGESPERVFFVGAPGLEHLQRLPLLSWSELEKELDFPLSSPLLLITYHPVTLEGSPEKPFGELLHALEDFPDARLVFTMPNADAEGRGLIRMIQNFVGAHTERAKAFVSLGQKRYLSLMKLCDAVVGNSSSGLTEAPAFGKPTVNIGNRQKGRLKADSVIDCAEERRKIADAIALALTPAFAEKARNTVSLYGSGNVAKKIVKVLKTCNLDGILAKKFFNVEWDEKQA